MSSESQNLKVLCLDGGGVRGVSSLQVLKSLFDAMQIREKPCEFFHIICGTSTGGIIAIMLGRLRMSLGDCIAQYDKLAEEVFEKPQTFGDSKYDHKVLERVLKRVIREQMAEWPENKDLTAVERQQLEDAPLLDKSLVDPNYKGEKGCPTVVFTIPCQHANAVAPTSLRSFKRMYDISDELPIWKAARATSAAPTYFKPIPLALRSPRTHDHMDGGLGFNNPGKVVLNELTLLKAQPGTKYEPLDHIGLFLSVGTGFQEIIRLKPETFKQSISKYFRMPLNLVDALLAMANSTEITHLELQELFGDDVHRYWRFSLDGPTGQIELDDYKSIDILEIDTDQYMKRQKAAVGSFVKRVYELKNQHQREHKDEGSESIEQRFRALQLTPTQIAIPAAGTQNSQPSPFLKLTSKREHIGPSLEDESQYWSRVTRPAIEIYKEVFNDIPKIFGNMVTYRQFKSYFTQLNISSGQISTIWNRLLLRDSVAPKNYVLACICMVHFEIADPRIKPQNSKGVPGISPQMEDRLAHFGDWTLCQCRKECKMEWSFLRTSWDPPLEGNDPNCMIMQRRMRGGDPTPEEEAAWKRTLDSWLANPERPWRGAAAFNS